MPVPSQRSHISGSGPFGYDVPVPSQAGHFCSDWTGALRCSSTRSGNTTKATLNFPQATQRSESYPSIAIRNSSAEVLFLALHFGHSNSIKVSITFTFMFVCNSFLLSKSRATQFHRAPRSSTKPPCTQGERSVDELLIRNPLGI